MVLEVFVVLLLICLVPFMVDTILNIVLAALSIWESKEAKKYTEQLIDLRQKYYEEKKKPLDTRNNAYLDDLLFRMCNIADAVATEIKRSKAGN